MTSRQTKRRAARRRRPGRPKLPPGAKKDINRSVKLTPEQAAAHDAARGKTPWAQWICKAADLVIAQGSPR